MNWEEKLPIRHTHTGKHLKGPIGNVQSVNSKLLNWHFITHITVCKCDSLTISKQLKMFKK